jgi:nitrate/nitrite-specific signal transduction histidine kinase
MATGVLIPGGDETIDLQQQVARLQALLEASRQVHSTIREEEVLEQVLKIVVRELEMAGAAFTGTGLSYGEEVTEGADGLLRVSLDDRDGKPMTELLVRRRTGAR